MTDKYLYFRTATSEANDDQGQDSVCYPLSKFRGFTMGAYGDSDAAADEDAFVMVFDSLYNDTAGDDENFDTVVVNIKTDNNAKEVWRALSEIFALSNQPFLVVGDDAKKEYLHSDIETIGAITLVDAG